MYSLAISPLALCCSITKLSIPHPGSWLSWPPSLSLPGSVWVWSRCFPSFRPIPSLSSPLSLMQGKCLLLFPGKKKGKKKNQTCANHFLCDRGEGILCWWWLCPETWSSPSYAAHKDKTLIENTLDLSPLFKCLVYTFLVAFVRGE